MRACQQCGQDISERHYMAKYCAGCALEVNRRQASTRYHEGKEARFRTLWLEGKGGRYV